MNTGLGPPGELLVWNALVSDPLRSFSRLVAVPAFWPIPAMLVMFCTATPPAPMVAMGVAPNASKPGSDTNRNSKPPLKLWRPLVQFTVSPYWYTGVMRLLAPPVAEFEKGFVIPANAVMYGTPLAVESSS